MVDVFAIAVAVVIGGKRGSAGGSQGSWAEVV